MKSALRTEALARRHDARRTAGDAAGAAIADNFLRHLVWSPDDVIAGYHPLGDEADVRPLLTRIVALGGTTVLPVVTAKDAPLAFRRWIPGDPLDPGPYGTRQPMATAEALRPTIVLVPLLAFDGAGRRLGFGGGYYDRTLAFLRGTRAGHTAMMVAVGIAYAGQEMADVPVESHDQALDWVVTETEARRFGR
jgi:5-formyltetrahydrofolate cyclo-ligase